MVMTQMMKLNYEQELSGNLQLGWTQLEKMDQRLDFFYIFFFFFGSEKEQGFNDVFFF